MTEPPFADRLAALGLHRFPEADRPGLERLVRDVEAAAARLRLPYGYEEEPSNVFRLLPAAPKGAGR